MTDTLKGRKILLVEDSPVVSDVARDALAELGCEIVGPAANMARARELALEAEIDGAIVDLRIRGDKSFPICDILAGRGVPFVLTSGYADWTMPDALKERPQLPKPYTIDDLEAVLGRLFGADSTK